MRVIETVSGAVTPSVSTVPSSATAGSNSQTQVSPGVGSGVAQTSVSIAAPPAMTVQTATIPKIIHTSNIVRTGSPSKYHKI